MTTTCAGCKSNAFELVVTSPTGSDYNVQVLQCKGCGIPIGAMDNGITVNTGINNLEQQLAQVSRKLDQVINNQIYSINLKVDRIETEIGNVRYYLGNR